MKAEEKTQEQIINELREKVAELEKSVTQCERYVEKLPVTNCSESYTCDSKTKAEEIKAYLEFFSYEAK